MMAVSTKMSLFHQYRQSFKSHVYIKLLIWQAIILSIHKTHFYLFCGCTDFISILSLFSILLLRVKHQAAHMLRKKHWRCCQKLEISVYANKNPLFPQSAAHFSPLCGSFRGRGRKSVCTSVDSNWQEDRERDQRGDTDSLRVREGKQEQVKQEKSVE